MNIIEARAEARRRYGIRSFAKKTRQGWFMVGKRVDFPSMRMYNIDDVIGSSPVGFAEAFKKAEQKEAVCS